MNRAAHARDALALIFRILRHEITPTARVMAFEDFARRYPGVGWEEAVTQTRPLVALAAYRAQQAREEEF